MFRTIRFYVGDVAQALNEHVKPYERVVAVYTAPDIEHPTWCVGRLEALIEDPHTAYVPKPEDAWAVLAESGLRFSPCRHASVLEDGQVRYMWTQCRSTTHCTCTGPLKSPSKFDASLPPRGAEPPESKEAMGDDSDFEGDHHGT